MGDTRIRYGLAYGRMNNFYTGSTDQTTRGYLAGTDGLFKQADTTPDVTNGYLFYTNNSAATTISTFDLSHPVGANTGNLAGLFEGKVIKVLFLDSNTTVAGTQIYLANSDNLFAANSVIKLMYHNSAWYEISRVNARKPVYTFTQAGSSSINADLCDSLAIITGTATPTILKSISGGYVGQKITITNGSGLIVYGVESGGNIMLGNTGNITFTNATHTGFAFAASFIKINSSLWACDGFGDE